MLSSFTILTACTNLDAKKDRERDDVHFQVMVKKSMSHTDALTSLYVDAAANFNLTHPDINVIIDFIPELSKGVFRSQDVVKILRSDEPQDIVPWSGMSNLDIVEKDHLLMDLLPLQTGEIDMNQSILDHMMINGKLLSLPFAAYPNVIIYNKELFDAAGVPYPEGDWTWEEFRDISRLIKPYGPVLSYSPFTLSILMAGYEQGLLSPDGATTIDYLDSAEAIRKVQWLNAYYHDAPQLPAIINDIEIYGLFDSRQIGMIVGNSGTTFSSFDGVQKQLLGYAPLPHFEGSKRANPIGYQGYGISAKSKHPEAAWKFIQYLALSVNEDTSKLANQYVATSKSVAEANGQHVDPIKSLMIEEMNYSVSSSTNNSHYYSEAWNPEFIGLFQQLLTMEEKDVSIKLLELALRVDQEMARLKAIEE
jgi:multiple sugar transport system substrate-binding protein